MTPADLAARDARIAELAALGWSHERIALDVNMSRRGISNAVARIGKGRPPRDAVRRPERDACVKRLLAAGVKRRDVADRLHITVRTVDRLIHDSRRPAATLASVGTLTASAAALAARYRSPTPQHSWVLVTWTATLALATPWYYKTREHAEAAAPTDGSVWSVVDLSRKAKRRPLIAEIVKRGRPISDMPAGHKDEDRWGVSARVQRKDTTAT